VLSGAERAAAQAWAGFGRLWLGDLGGAAASAEQARSTAAAAEDHLTICIAMASLALVSNFRGQVMDALQIIDDAIRLADQSAGMQGHRFPLHLTRCSSSSSLTGSRKPG
jgi:hypothetical protein